jgi:putative peptidoglycan lipid II flippase
MRLIRSIATISFHTMLSRIAGFVRTVLMSTFVGAGAMADALVISIKFPSVMRRVFAEGAFNASFVPIFAGMLAKDGHENARTYAEQVFSLLVLVLAGIVLMGEVFMPWILKVILPGFSRTPERMAYVIQFTRITLPFILFISVCALFSGILNSLERFAFAASSPTGGNLTIIAVVFLLKGQMENAAQAFAIGVTLSGVVQALWVLIPAWRSGYRLRLTKIVFSPVLKKFFVLLIPAAAGAGVVQINILLDMLMGSFLPVGGISYLEYADRLNQLPLSVVGVAMGTALLPMLSKQLRTNDLETAHKTQNLALEYALFLAVPAMIGLCVLAMPIVKIVYEHGKMAVHDIEQIAITLVTFALGLPAYIMIKIFSSIFFARENTKTPVQAGIIAMLLNLILNLLLIKPLQHVGLALATAIAAWFNSGYLFYYLHKEGAMPISKRFALFLPKLGVASAVCLGVLYGMKIYFWPLMQGNFTYRVLGLCVMVGVGIITYLSFSFITGIIKKSDLKWPQRSGVDVQASNVDS